MFFGVFFYNRLRYLNKKKVEESRLRTPTIADKDGWVYTDKKSFQSTNPYINADIPVTRQIKPDDDSSVTRPFVIPLIRNKVGGLPMSPLLVSKDTEMNSLEYPSTMGSPDQFEGQSSLTISRNKTTEPLNSAADSSEFEGVNKFAGSLSRFKAMAKSPVARSEAGNISSDDYPADMKSPERFEYFNELKFSAQQERISVESRVSDLTTLFSMPESAVGSPVIIPRSLPAVLEDQSTADTAIKDIRVMDPNATVDSDKNSPINSTNTDAKARALSPIAASFLRRVSTPEVTQPLTPRRASQRNSVGEAYLRQLSEQTPRLERCISQTGAIDGEHISGAVSLTADAYLRSIEKKGFFDPVFGDVDSAIASPGEKAKRKSVLAEEYIRTSSPRQYTELKEKQKKEREEEEERQRLEEYTKQLLEEEAKAEEARLQKLAEEDNDSNSGITDVSKNEKPLSKIAQKYLATVSTTFAEKNKDAAEYQPVRRKSQAIEAYLEPAIIVSSSPEGMSPSSANRRGKVAKVAESYLLSASPQVQQKFSKQFKDLEKPSPPRAPLPPKAKSRLAEMYLSKLTSDVADMFTGGDQTFVSEQPPRTPPVFSNPSPAHSLPVPRRSVSILGNNMSVNDIHTDKASADSESIAPEETRVSFTQLTVQERRALWFERENFFFERLQQRLKIVKEAEAAADLVDAETMNWVKKDIGQRGRAKRDSIQPVDDLSGVYKRIPAVRRMTRTIEPRDDANDPKALITFPKVLPRTDELLMAMSRLKSKATKTGTDKSDAYSNTRGSEVSDDSSEPFTEVIVATASDAYSHMGSSAYASYSPTTEAASIEESVEQNIAADSAGLALSSTDRAKTLSPTRSQKMFQMFTDSFNSASEKLFSSRNSEKANLVKIPPERVTTADAVSNDSTIAPAIENDDTHLEPNETSSSSVAIDIAPSVSSKGETSVSEVPSTELPSNEESDENV